MNHKAKRILTLIMLAAMLLSLPVIGASAAGEEPTGEEAAGATTETANSVMPPLTDLTLTVYRKGKDTVMPDITNANVVIDLYLIAAAEEDTAHGATIKFGTPNAKSGITAEQLSYDKLPKTTDPEGTAAAYWEKIRSAAAKAILPTGAPAYAATVTGAPADQAITGLAGGLYLIVARDGSATADYADYREENDAGEVATRAYSDLHVYTYLPQLVVLPGTENGSTAAAEWVDPFEVYMKPEESNRIGRLVLQKTVPAIEEHSDATFVFHVVGKLTEGGTTSTVYDDYLSITFGTEDGGKTIKYIDPKPDPKTGKPREYIELPVGTVITVEEVYSGSCYKLDSLTMEAGGKSTDTIPVPIDAAGKELSLVVTAVNSYKPNDIHIGYGIQNTFEQNGQSWLWYKDGVLQNGGTK